MPCAFSFEGDDGEGRQFIVRRTSRQDGASSARSPTLPSALLKPHQVPPRLGAPARSAIRKQAKDAKLKGELARGLNDWLKRPVEAKSCGWLLGVDSGNAPATFHSIKILWRIRRAPGDG